MKIKRKDLEAIAHKVINGYNGFLRETIVSLNESDLMRLHYVMVKTILEYEKDDVLFEAITAYVKGLTRLHRGYFWKILNYFEWYLSALWYKHTRENVELILYSLCPHPEDGSMLDPNSEDFKIRVKSLDSVFDLTVKKGKYGLKRDEEEHGPLPPTPKK